ncbi:MAG: hypothetical protein V2A56_11965 [bacterium]
MKKPFLPIFLVLISVSPSLAFTPLGWSVGVDAGSTSNLFNDSLDIEDRYGSLSLSLEQILSPNLLVTYDGYGQTYNDYGDLSNIQHLAGLEVGGFVGSRGEAWGAVQGFTLGYGDAYNLYNRRGYGAETGINWYLSNRLRLRATGSWNATHYPNADTLAVDYNDLQVYGGVNIATTINLAADLETGLQRRSYSDLNTATSTTFSWTTLRLSGRLGQGTGGALTLMMRSQLSVGSKGLVALYEGGVDPGNLLWDGWRVGGEVNRIAGPWRFTLGGQVGVARYVEIQALTDREARDDTTRRLMVALRRTLNTPPEAPAVAVGFSVSWTDNASTVSYFTWSGFSATVSLSLISL